MTPLTLSELNYTEPSSFDESLNNLVLNVERITRIICPIGTEPTSKTRISGEEIDELFRETTAYVMNLFKCDGFCPDFAVGIWYPMRERLQHWTRRPAIGTSLQQAFLKTKGTEVFRWNAAAISRFRSWRKDGEKCQAEMRDCSIFFSSRVVRRMKAGLHEPDLPLASPGLSIRNADRQAFIDGQRVDINMVAEFKFLETLHRANGRIVSYRDIEAALATLPNKRKNALHRGVQEVDRLPVLSNLATACRNALKRIASTKTYDIIAVRNTGFMIRVIDVPNIPSPNISLEKSDA